MDSIIHLCDFLVSQTRKRAEETKERTLLPTWQKTKIEQTYGQTTGYFDQNGDKQGRWKETSKSGYTEIDYIDNEIIGLVWQRSIIYDEVESI